MQVDRRILKRAKRLQRMAGSEGRMRELLTAVEANPNIDVQRYALHLAEKGSWDEAIKIAKEGREMATTTTSEVKDDDLVEVTENGKQVFRTVGELKASGLIGNRENAAVLVEEPAIKSGSVVDQVLSGITGSADLALSSSHVHTTVDRSLPYNAKFLRDHPNLLDTRARTAGDISPTVGEVTWRVGEAFVAADGTSLWFGDDFWKPSDSIAATFEKVDRIKKDLPNKPTNRDRLLKAVNSVLRLPKRASRKQEHVETIGRSLRAASMDAEWFDFGNIDANTLVDCADDARPLANEGLVFLPYPSVVFRTRIVTGKSAAEFVLLCEDYRASVIDKARSKEFITIYALQIRGLDSQIADTRDIIGFNLTDPHKSRVIGSDNEESVHLIQMFLALWMILNTKNVRRETIEPDRKLAKARAASGKPPAKSVTRIDSQQYITALRQTQLDERAEHQGGTHRSPKPHLRRAHFRPTLENAKLWGVKAAPIPAVIVNGSEALKVAKRERYKVEAV